VFSKILFVVSLLVFAFALGAGAGGADPNIFVPICLVSAVFITGAFASLRR
jgi:hypothetical protein